MKQIGTWLAPDVAARPSRATSLAVSKPSPNRTPSGYMCQLFRIEPERRPQQPGEEAPVLQEVLERLLVVRAALRDPAEHPVDVDEDDQVDHPDERAGTRPRRWCR